MTKEFTIKQSLFCKEFLVDKHSTNAAIRAGYSKKTAYSIGNELLKKPEIRRQIQKELARQAVRIECSADKVMQEICKLAFVDAESLFDENGKMKDIKSLPKNVTACISSIDFDSMTGKITKVRLWDKRSSLEMLAKHFELLGKEDRDKDKDKDNYLIQIIDSFNGNGNGRKPLTQEDKENISKVREILHESIRSDN